MRKGLLRKALCLTMAVMVTGTSLSMYDGYTVVAETTTGVQAVNYVFDSTNAGYAKGTITVTSTVDDTYTLYWGDTNGNKLKRDGIFYSSLGDVTTTSGTGTYKVTADYAVIPQGAKTLLVYNEDSMEYKYDIPSNKIANLGTKKYTFGIMSDVHFNRYNSIADDDATVSLPKVFNFFEDTAKVAFVGNTGDISSNGEESSFQKFNNELAKHNLLVYSVLGNHDVSAKDTHWFTYMNKGITSKNASKNGILQVADNKRDFVYQVPGQTNDVFIFLGQVTWLYNYKSSYLLEESQLYWLEEMLDIYANKNVYLFFHTYFASNDGDITDCVGNLKNGGGYSYDLTYTYGNTDEKKFRKLLNKHANVTIFSGHSHWAYAMQQFNPNLNVGKFADGSATAVHVSSVTEPRIIGENDVKRTGLNGKASEAMVADVYGNHTIYTGVDVWNNEYYAYATYMVENGKKTTPVIKKAPNNAKVKKLIRKKASKKKITIKLKKLSKAKGYQIQYSTSKKFKAKKTTTKITKKTQITIKKLKPKKKYYVRVRAYINAYGEKRYGKWSKVKSK